MIIQDLIHERKKYTKMNFDFNNIQKDLQKIINEGKKHMTPQQQIQVNQFQNKAKNMFKDIDLSDPTKINLDSLNLRIEELKKLQDGLANS